MTEVRHQCPRCYAIAKVTLAPGLTAACGRCAESSLNVEAPRGVRFVYGKLPVPDVVPKERAFGRYRLDAEVGRGGMGVVYRAVCLADQRAVAVKVLLSGPHAAPEHSDRFLREAHAISRLSHPSVVRITDFGTVEGRVYFAMALVEGPTLQQLIEDRGALPVTEAIRIGRALAAALASAHRAGIVHRDVKPGNILLTEEGTPVLTDFGLAAETDALVTRITRTGQVLGTPTYMAPEQTRAGTTTTTATDQYALGAVLYEMLCGVPPYDSSDAISVLTAIASGPPPPLQRRRKDLPKRLLRVVSSAMARHPAHRYADMDALARDLQRCRTGETLDAPVPPLPHRLLHTWQRNQRTVILCGTAALAVLTVLLVFLAISEVQRKQGRQRREADASRSLAHLIATDPDEDLLQAFAEDAAYRDTVAAADAWLSRAERLSERGDATAAWADAFARARHATQQDAALRGLALGFRARWAWSSLDSVVGSLKARNQALLHDPVVAHWEAEAKVAQLDLVGAHSVARLAGLPDTDLLWAMAATTPLSVSLDVDAQYYILPSDSGGELWVFHPARRALAKISESGQDDHNSYVLPAPVAPGELFLLDTDDGVAALAHHQQGNSVLYRLREGLAQPMGTMPGSKLLAAASMDLDGDGAREIWVGVGPYDREIVRLFRTAVGVYAVDRPLPMVDAARSDVLALLPTVGPFGSELIVASGAWAAYDLRAIRARAGPGSGALGTPDGGFTMAARHKLGVVSALQNERAGTFLAAKSDLYPSRVVFPAERPFGQPAGVYRFRRTPDGFESERIIANPLPPGGGQDSLGPVTTIDLDRDGEEEIVFSADNGEGRFGVVIVSGRTGMPWILEGLRLLGRYAGGVLVQDDADGVPFVLGIGSTQLAGRDVPKRAAARPIPAGATGVARAWIRAEELVEMGLHEAALHQFERIALAGASEDALLRAATLATAMGEDHRAAASYEALGTDDALTNAAEAHERAHAFGRAHELWLRIGEQGRADALAGTLPVLTTSASFRDHATHSDPLLTAQVANGLRVTMLSDGPSVLRLPVTWSGDHRTFSVTLDLVRLEWAGGLRLSVGDAAAFLFVEVTGWGGGEQLEREIACGVSDGPVFRRRTPMPDLAAPAHLVLTMDMSSHTGEAHCTFDVNGVRTQGTVQLPDGLPAGAGQWLEVAPSTHGGVDVSALATAVLVDLSLTGQTVAIGAAAQRPADQTVNHPVNLAVAAARRGDPRAAEFLTGIVPDRRVAHALRTHLATFGPIAREALGTAYFEWFDRAYRVLMDAHPDDGDLALALTAGLPPDLSGADVALRGRLLLARGRAWAKLGHADAARRDLLTAARIGPADDTSPGDADRRAALAWLELATLLAREGRTAEAEEALREALAVGPAPEVTADMIRARPAIAPLVDRVVP